MAGAALCLLLIGAAEPQPLVPTAKDLAGYRADTIDTGSYPDAALIAWQNALRDALHGNSLEQAVIAGDYGLDPATMRRLASAFIIAKQRQYGPDNSWKRPVHASFVRSSRWCGAHQSG